MSVATIRNRLLRALPPDILLGIRGELTLRPFAARAVVHELGAPIDHILFVETGMVSVTVTDPEGDTVEVAALGDEGLAGVAGVLGFRRSPANLCFQLAGAGHVMAADAFRREFGKEGPFRDVAMAYVRARHVQMMQTILCHRRHSLDQRLSRWLLTARDYSHCDHVPLTHQVIAEMLGVHRPAVTIATRSLQDRGAIHCGRGGITITDVAGLRAATCACYRIVREQMAQLLPPQPDSHRL